MTKDIDDDRLDSPQAGTGARTTFHNDIKSTRVGVISTADDKVNVSEPSSPSHAQYPYNKAEQTLSGHLTEFDDTPGAERIMEMHKSGTFYEIHPDGSKVTRIYGDDFYIILSDHNLVVGGNLNITVQGDANLLVKGNMKQKIAGNYDLTVHGNMTTRIRGTQVNYTKGDLDIQTKGNLRIRSELTSEFQAVGKLDIKTENVLSMRSESIARFFAKGRLFVDGSRVDFNLPGSDPGKSKVLDKDPTGGLEVAESVIEPSIESLMINRSDNSALSGINNTGIKYPKDRINID